MNMISTELRQNSWICIESPHLDEAAFTTNWLLDALEADRLLKECFLEDAEFRFRARQLQGTSAVEFSAAAMIFVLLCGYDGMMSLEVSDDDNMACFALMALIGFYTQNNANMYEMTHPPELNTTVIKEAVLKLANLDGCGRLHPSHLLTTMSKQSVRECEQKHPGAPWWE